MLKKAIVGLLALLLLLALIGCGAKNDTAAAPTPNSPMLASATRVASTEVLLILVAT